MKKPLVSGHFLLLLKSHAPDRSARLSWSGFHNQPFDPGSVGPDYSSTGLYAVRREEICEGREQGCWAIRKPKRAYYMSSADENTKVQSVVDFYNATWFSGPQSFHVFI